MTVKQEVLCRLWVMNRMAKQALGQAKNELMTDLKDTQRNGPTQRNGNRHHNQWQIRFLNVEQTLSFVLG